MCSLIPKCSFPHFGHLLVLGDLLAEGEVGDRGRLHRAMARVVIVMGVGVRTHPLFLSPSQHC